MPRSKSSQNPVETAESAAPAVEGQDDTVSTAHNVDVEKVIAAAQGGEVQTSDEVATRKVEFVKYVGKATHRTIESGTWPKGCEQDLTAEWGFFNDFKIPASSFTEEQLDYLLEAVNEDGSRVDAGFELIEEDVAD
ncbi:hypothetical protein SEA_DUMPTRUCK_21 [Gordonia phage DumpTruck]|nr:hypothetical protein SEA_DUMPTRUCK_21 [Gordonia phage DumpTruck]